MKYGFASLLTPFFGGRLKMQQKMQQASCQQRNKTVTNSAIHRNNCLPADTRAIVAQPLTV
ncbi:hypothetical protein [Andreprevotia lacus]|jgi:hypothetical protein|uniref:hypothetical protein n=1 Tax=Andreprevotia lacus TaxID=1121000 RepID=UPI00111C02C3|nr:hypothetical protein [Andreprevotia lacus]